MRGSGTDPRQRGQACLVPDAPPVPILATRRKHRKNTDKAKNSKTNKEHLNKTKTKKHNDNNTKQKCGEKKNKLKTNETNKSISYQI